MNLTIHTSPLFKLDVDPTAPVTPIKPEHAAVVDLLQGVHLGPGNYDVDVSRRRIYAREGTMRGRVTGVRRGSGSFGCFIVDVEIVKGLSTFVLVSDFCYRGMLEGFGRADAVHKRRRCLEQPLREKGIARLPTAYGVTTWLQSVLVGRDVVVSAVERVRPRGPITITRLWPLPAEAPKGSPCRSSGSPNTPPISKTTTTAS